MTGHLTIKSLLQHILAHGIFWSVPLLFLLSAPAAANETEIVKVSLISEVQSAPPKENVIWIGLHQKIISGWHTYWRYAGDSGLPTKISWTKSENVKTGAIHWPLPKVIKIGPLVNYGYEGETLLLVPLTITNSGPINLKAKVEWLACKEICVPQKKVLDLHLPAGNGYVNADNVALFNWYKKLIPVDLPWPVQVLQKGRSLRLHLSMDKREIEEFYSFRVFPGLDGLIENSGLQTFKKNKYNIIINLMAGYAVVEGLNSFEGVIKINSIRNRETSYRAYRISPSLLSSEKGGAVR